MKSSSHAENVEGQFKVSRGHPRSNGLPLLYGIETWWVESSLDTKYLKVSSKSPVFFLCVDIHVCSIIVWTCNWWLESSLDAENVEGQFKVTGSRSMSQH